MRHSDIWGFSLVTTPARDEASEDTDAESRRHRCIRRPLLVMEYFGVQGILVLLPKSHPLSALLPSDLRFSPLMASARRGRGHLTPAQLKSIARNGQHASSVSACLMLIMCGVEVDVAVGDSDRL